LDENIQSGSGLLSESSVEQARAQGKVWLSGQLAGEDSLVEVLELLEGANLQCALLRILSKSARGYIAIQDATTISGAHVTSTLENGLQALQKLLGAPKGIFLVMEVDEHPAELQQSMKLSVTDLLGYRTSGSTRRTLKEPLDTYANEHADLFATTVSNKAATALASFESYLAWGDGEEEAPAPPPGKSLFKITQQIRLGGNTSEKKVEVENILDRIQEDPHEKAGPGVIVTQGPSPANPFARLTPPPSPPQITPSPAPPVKPPPPTPARGYHTGQHAAPAPQVPPVPPIPPLNQQPGADQGGGQEQWSLADLDAIPAPGGEARTAPDSKPEQAQPRKLTGPSARIHRDDEQSMSQRIATLRDDQMRLSQKLKAADIDMIDEGPVRQLSPEEQLKKNIMSIAMGATGLLLFIALGHQIFNITTGFAKYRSGVEALKAGDNARAQVEFSVAINQNNDPRALLYRAVAESRLGHKEDALRDFNTLIGRNPKNRLARLGKATLLIKNKAFDDAIAECDELLKHDPEAADAWRLKALANCMAGRYKEAIDEATLYLDKNAPTTDGGKGRAEVYASRAFSYLKVDKFEQAAADFSEALKLDPKNSKMLAGRAVAYQKLKAWAHALEDVQAAIELDPSNAGLFKLRGQYYANAGDAAKAAADLDRAAKMRPSVEAFRLRGIARLQAKDYAEALQDFEYLLTVNPNDKDAKAKYDMARNALRGEGKTIASVEALTGSKPEPTPTIKGTPEQLTERGYLLLQSKQTDDAIAVLTAAVKARPNNVNARRYLAYAFAQNGDHDNAITQFSELAGVLPYFTPEDSTIYGKELYASGNYGEAAQVLNPVMSQQPRNDDARTCLINSLIKGGLGAQAIPLCDEGARLSPAKSAAYMTLKKAALAAR
jgi:tetratricopeptide (TPR) repeat protein